MYDKSVCGVFVCMCCVVSVRCGVGVFVWFVCAVFVFVCGDHVVFCMCVLYGGCVVFYVWFGVYVFVCGWVFVVFVSVCVCECV